MKYTVNFKRCGHEAQIDLVGKFKDRERKIEYMSDCCLCPSCQRAKSESEKSAGCKKVRMHYSEYKNKYAECKTEYNSYDSKDKTIVVYVPEN